MTWQYQKTKELLILNNNTGYIFSIFHRSYNIITTIKKKKPLQSKMYLEINCNSYTCFNLFEQLSSLS